MKWIENALNNFGDISSILQIRRVYGGSINECYFVQTKKQKYFIKHHEQPPKDFFQTEKIGLTYLRSSETISVPEVYSVSDDVGEAYLLLEWIEGRKRAHTEQILGKKLAALHQTRGKSHGFSTNTYIGLLPQPNGLYDDWLTYYRERKLLGQINYGIKKGVIDLYLQRRLEILLSKLDQWLPRDVIPSYLHGDLWGGNWIVGAGGEPYLIDPSFFFGDRHMEIAFTEMFGGFSKQFYDAYHDTYPLADTYQDIKPLYQLYYLIVHLNMFGKSYAKQIEQIIKRYIGK